jgi:hypothetical protein
MTGRIARFLASINNRPTVTVVPPAAVIATAILKAFGWAASCYRGQPWKAVPGAFSSQGRYGGEVGESVA